MQNSRKLLTNWKIQLGLILLVGLVLRLVSLNQSFWLDEAINVSAARDLSLNNLVFKYMLGDFHPPLYSIILWIWFKIVPATEVFARVPSIIFGLASIVLVFLIGKIVDKRKSLLIPSLSALFLATSGLHIYYSQEARMYIFATFLSSLVFYLLLKLKKRQSTFLRVFFILSLTTLLLSDYQPWTLLPIFFLSFSGLSSLGMLLTLPWWPSLLRQLHNGISIAKAAPAWGTVVGKLTLKSTLLIPIKFLIGRVSIDNNLLYAVVLLIPAVTVTLLIIKAIKVKNQPMKLLFRWAFVPLVVSLFIAIRIPIVTYFRYLFILPAFYLLIAVGISKLNARQRILAISVILTTNLISTAAYLAIPKFHREDWRAATNFISTRDLKSALVVLPNKAQAAGLEYYSQGSLNLQDLGSFKLEDDTKEVFLIRYVQEIFDPEDKLRQSIEENGFEKIAENSFNGVVIWNFRRLDQ